MNSDLEAVSTGLSRTKHLLIAVCAFLAVAFAAVILMRSPRSGEISRAVVPSPASTDRDAPSGTVNADEVARQTLGKAPFRTLRNLAPKVVDDSGRYELAGISVRNGEKRAYIKDTKLDETYTLYVGDRLGTQYELVAIERDSVQLRHGSETIALRK